MILRDIKTICTVVDHLDGDQCKLFIEDSRDGDTTLSEARIEVRRFEDGTVGLLVRYE